MFKLPFNAASIRFSFQDGKMRPWPCKGTTPSANALRNSPQSVRQASRLIHTKGA